MMMEAQMNAPIGKVRAMNPKIFGLWLFIISITMIFISLSSAYIVKQAEGNWRIFEFPDLFKVTSLIIVLSSVSMHWSYIAAKRNNLLQIRLGLVVTAILGAAFMIGQFVAWNELVSIDVNFSGGNPAESFVYVFTGLHVAHLVGGVIFLAVMLKASFSYKVHSKSLTKIEMCTTYWHFLGGLWLYLYLFLVLNN